jgi:glyoxylase-like metal-dependent hydrolase (beta-lactamase superfamily II)
MADIKKISSKPVKYVFDTHHHGDHAYANALWTKAGRDHDRSHRRCNEMKAREPERWLAAAKEREDVRALKLNTAEPPKETFSKSPHVITDGVRRIELHYFGWAHTKGDGFLYLPPRKSLPQATRW